MSELAETITSHNFGVGFESQLIRAKLFFFNPDHFGIGFDSQLIG